MFYENRIVTDEPQKETNDSYRQIYLSRTGVSGIHLLFQGCFRLKIEAEKEKQSAAVSERTASPDTSGSLKKRGRPPSSKKRKTLEREALVSAHGEVSKRGKGRPPGSKNKKTLEQETLSAAQGVKTVKRKRGRPPGSKNKRALEREVVSDSKD